MGFRILSSSTLLSALAPFCCLPKMQSTHHEDNQLLIFFWSIKRSVLQQDRVFELLKQSWTKEMILMVANKLFRLALFMVTFKHGNIFIHRIWKADCVPSILQNFEYGVWVSSALWNCDHENKVEFLRKW